jgi:tRNA (guanine37-N1)-methyltransferase
VKVYVLTLFPEMFQCVLGSSILKRAQDEGLMTVRLVDVRDFSRDPHRTVDDYPYGGGPGMVMKPEPVLEAIDWVEEDLGARPYVVLMTPQGRRFDATVARELAGKHDLCLVAGHYEGFDERIRETACDEVSIGDFVLTGGEIPAMAVLDAVSRFVPGVLGDEASASADSFSDGLLEGPQYTRPPEYRGMKVPEVLVRGDHAAVSRWRRKEAIRRTYRRRPELLDGACLTFEDRRYLEEVKREEVAKIAAKDKTGVALVKE